MHTCTLTDILSFSPGGDTDRGPLGKGKGGNGKGKARETSEDELEKENRR